MKSYISGNLRTIIYESPNSTYKVGVFKVRETNNSELEEYVNKTITFTGNFNDVNKEFDYILYGSVSNHPRYGFQFIVETYEIREPTDTDGIIMYLSSGIFKGIGLKTAKSIVDTLGEDAIKKIKEGYECLLLVQGLSENKARSLYEKLNEYEMDQEAIIKLNNLGFSTKESLNILNNHKVSINTILEKDIYSLKELVPFEKLDSIYLKNNEEDSEIRIKALIIYLIDKLCYSSGDTLIDIESLFISMKSKFNKIFTLDKFMNVINKMKTVSEIIEINNYLTLPHYYETEHFIAQSVSLLNKIRSDYEEQKVNKAIIKYESNNKIEFNQDQKEAIKNAILKNLYLISGGPGTGKTTIVKAIVDIYKSLSSDRNIALLAPTGRSAKRLGESVRERSYTIHKFLKWNKETSSFSVNEYNQSDANLVIIDEFSMVDIFLFSSLLKGLKTRVKLILVGDANQLPSIGPGNILHDLLNIEKIHKKFLHQIYRVKEGSFIIDFANKIKNIELIQKFDEKYTDFKFIESTDLHTKEYLIDICNNIKTKKINIDTFQVLAPMYKGENGIDNLNKLMQSIFNPLRGRNEIESLGNVYRVNDKVIQLVNDMDNNVFNGDIGYIKSVDKTGKIWKIEIDFMGNIVEYKSGEFEHFTLAYAISIHKSQGSEYDNVVVILSRSFSRMFYNKLIYTAVTRAKKNLVIIGSIESLNKSICTLYASNRITYLKNLF